MIHGSVCQEEGEEPNQPKQGDDAMSNSVMDYAALDLHSLAKKNIKVISSKKALENVNPIEWEEDILKGRKKITVAKKKEWGVSN